MTGSPDFMERALCPQTDPVIFYPEEIAGGEVRQAKRVCMACEVSVECLEYALDNREQYGVWGGLSANERRTLLRKSGVYLPREHEEDVEEDVESSSLGPIPLDDEEFEAEDLLDLLARTA